MVEILDLPFFIMNDQQIGNGKPTQHRVKELRADLQRIMAEVVDWEFWEARNAFTKLVESKMWLEQFLGRLGSEDLNAARDKKELEESTPESRADESVAKDSEPKKET